MLADERSDSLMFPLYPAGAVDKAADGWQQNVADWAGVLKGYREGLELCASQGAKHYEQRHKGRGLLLGKFPLICRRCVDNSEGPSQSVVGSRYTVPGAGIVCGVQTRDFIAFSKSDHWYRSNMVTLWRYVETKSSGVKCMIIAHIPTISGAAWNEFTLIKQNRMTEIANENHLPLISLVQSVSLPNMLF
jgi:hypothetical protein